MKLEIQKYVQECQNEQASPRKNSTTYILMDTLAIVFDKVSMDIVEPLSITESGHSYVFTIQDY